MSKETKVPFDFAAWRVRLKWTKDQAQAALGVSRTYYWQLEKTGTGPRMAAWAAYGLECYQLRNALKD